MNKQDFHNESLECQFSFRFPSESSPPNENIDNNDKPSCDDQDLPEFPFSVSPNSPPQSRNPLVHYSSESESDNDDNGSITGDMACKRKVVNTESNLDQSPKRSKAEGLLRYFKRETKEEHEDRLKHEAEADNERFEAAMMKAERRKMRMEEEKREQNRLRKQKSRARKRKQEIVQGIRDEDGQLPKRQKTMDLHDITEAFDVAEESRPARAIAEKIKLKTRKAAGHKLLENPVHEKRPARYVNWLTPFCWTQIKTVAKKTGMSPTEIVRELKK
ncbi:hypothetical protein E1B28_000063 [Marasmius oreades]|uniref:Uncharacterized protein n=1 Tax=Marasmius oreades TaxID=181124 RepID=A0A9P7V0L9_9AGAR|nr:uncharacterized protein E1B28_000063 [Marasmius oreades]KAG7098089.1 hypothetical protein E1B28_000063 [Marasmius oreades]